MPDEAGIGQAPQSLAKAASERIRSGLSPKMINIAAAVVAPTAKPSRRVGAVSAVSRSRCRSCVAISPARASQRRARDRSVCFPEAMGVSSGPGRSPAQRVTRARSGSACRGSRSTGGTLMMICRVHRGGPGFDRSISRDLELPHPTAPSAVLGVPVALRATGGRLGVDGVRLAGGSTQPPIGSIHFHDAMARATDRPGQADAVAASPFMPNASMPPCPSAQARSARYPAESASNEWSPRRMPRRSIATGRALSITIVTRRGPSPRVRGKPPRLLWVRPPRTGTHQCRGTTRTGRGILLTVKVPTGSIPARAGETWPGCP